MIYEIRGCLTTATTPLIAHGCNCFCVMGAGVALALKNKWSIVYNTDLATTRGDKSKLGTFSVARVSSTQTVLNCYTQFAFGRDKQHADYAAIRSCMKAIKKKYPGMDISMSPIGCGLAGGDWNVVRKIVEEELDDRNVYVYRL